VDNLWISLPGARCGPGLFVKLPDQLIADFRDFVGASSSRDPGECVKLPNSLMKNTRKLGFLDELPVAPGAPGVPPDFTECEK